MPAQTALKRLKMGMSGALEGPQHSVNTFHRISSITWWRQASHRSSRPIFFSSNVHDPFRCPVFPEVVSKLIAWTWSSYKRPQLPALQCLQPTSVHPTTFPCHLLKPGLEGDPPFPVQIFPEESYHPNEPQLDSSAYTTLEWLQQIPFRFSVSYGEWCIGAAWQR